MRRLAWVLLVALGFAAAACEGGPKPLGGATFSGPIEISGVASSGTLTFTISGDGETITSVAVELNDVQVPGYSAQHTGRTAYISIPAGGGSFDAKTAVGAFEGRFTTPTEARGTIDLRLQNFGLGTPSKLYELGRWEWSARAGRPQDAAWPWDDIPLYSGAAGVGECTDQSPYAQMYLGSSAKGVKQVLAWKFTTIDPPLEVLAFYERELSVYGWVSKQPAQFQEGQGGLFMEKGLEELLLSLSLWAGGTVEVTLVRVEREQ